MRRSLTPLLALAAWAGLLQACAASHSAGEQPAQNPAAATPIPVAELVGFVPGSGSAAARPARSPAPLRSPRAAKELAGLTEGQLVTLIGEPDLRRAEGGSEAWLYRSEACLLDVFLEADRPGTEPRVVHAAARSAAAVPIAEESCLRALARARAGLRSPFQP